MEKQKDEDKKGINALYPTTQPTKATKQKEEQILKGLLGKHICEGISRPTHMTKVHLQISSQMIFYFLF